MEGLMKRYPAWVIVGLLLLGAGKPAGAEVFEMFGASSRGAAMGGAMTATAEGTEAIFYNPSSIALSPDSTSLEWTASRAHLNVNGINFGAGNKDFGPMPTLFGLSQRFLRERVGIGLLYRGGFTGGGDVGGGTGIGVISNGWGTGFFGGGTIPITLGLGLRLHDKLAVGFSLWPNLYVRLSDVNLNIDELLQSIIGVTTGIPPVDLDPNVNLALSPVGNDVGISVMFKPVKYLSLGYVQRPGSWTRIKVPIILSSTGLLSSSMRIIIVKDLSSKPDQEQLGAAVHVPLGKSTLTLSWAQDHEFWGRQRKDRMKEVAQYKKSSVSGVVNVSYGAPSPINDISIDHYGLEYLMNAGFLPTKFLKQRNPQLAVRAGYFHWNSPLPDKLYGTTFDSDMDVYSGGLGLSLDRRGRKVMKDPTVPRRFSLDLHGQYFKVEDRDFKLSYDYYGNHRGNSSVYFYHYEGQITELGLQATWWH
jgi:hypothetical protein